MVAPRAKLKRCTYFVTFMSFTPAQLEASIQRHSPDFQVRSSARCVLWRWW
jgi:hypothetical protein